MKSILTPAPLLSSTLVGKTTKENRISIFIITCVYLILLLTSLAKGTYHIEGFEYPKPDSNSFSYDIFQHNIMPQPGLDYVSWNISDYGSPPSGNALQLWPAIDEITFTLAPGQYINYISYELINWTEETTVEISLEQCFLVGTFYAKGEWYFCDSTDWHEEWMGGIIKVRLISDEGAFDNITVNVVPEPTTITLFALGCVILRRRRKP